MIVLDAILQGILMGLLFALMALGLTIIFGVMDIVNFAHGEFLMIGMYTTYWTSLLLHIDPLITLPASAIVGMLLGLASYYWLVKYLIRGPMIAQLFGTFGLMLFLRYLAQFLFGTDYRIIQKGLLVGKTLSLGPFQSRLDKALRSHSQPYRISSCLLPPSPNQTGKSPQGNGTQQGSGFLYGD